MSSFLQIMMKNKGKLIPPVITVMTKAGENVKINSRTFNKQYDGFAYCCYFHYQDGGTDWESPMLVSEVRQNCAMKSNDGYEQGISSTPFSYKGKQWYYLDAVTSMSSSSNQNNGRFFLENGAIIPGSTHQEKHLNAAKLLLDYVYSFNERTVQFCDYISATGTQWIDTGLYASSTALNNYSIEVDCQFSRTSENAIAINSWAASAYFLMVYQNKCRWHGASGGSIDFGSVTTNTDYNIKVDIPNNKCYLNGTAYSYSRIGCGTAAIRLLGGYGTSGNYFMGKMYRTRFYDYVSPYNLVRDYVPAYCTTLSKYVFVDKVNNVFYENKGTGSFGGGN